MAVLCDRDRKFFFSEEKKQKTLVSCAAQSSDHGHSVGASSETKVFWFFFSKKNILSTFGGH